MARLSDDDFDRLRDEVAADSARPLGSVRRADGAARTAETQTWLDAGDRLAEKAIAALDTGDAAAAARLVARIVGLPVVDDDLRSGLMAVDLVLYRELTDPDDDVDGGLLEVPLRLLPTLEPAVADELRQTLASLTELGLPRALERRIAAVVPLERRLDPPFARVPEAELPAAVTGVLRLVLRLRGAD